MTCDVKRIIYRARIKSGEGNVAIQALKKYIKLYEIKKNEGVLLTASLFEVKENVFLYCEYLRESEETIKNNNGIFNYLQKWPDFQDKRFWVPMADIFHYNRPVSVEHWQRKLPVQKYTGRIARLKNDMIGSYIYYHHQRQEEQPASGSKYGIIGIHENLLFFYNEEPTILEEPKYVGKLKTHNTPDNWQTLMQEHFIPWEDVYEEERFWLNTNLIWTIGG